MEQVSRRRFVCFRPAFAGVLLLLASVPPAGSILIDGSEARARGDAAYARSDLAAARAAYADELALRPADFSALWKLARVESELGEAANGKAQKELVLASVEHARAAAKVAPDSAQGHAWLAAALGRQALKEGPKTRLSLSREIKFEAERALAIDPSNALAYHVRALWNRNVASLSFMERAAANTVLGGVPKGASMENAVRDLQRAIELEPQRVIHRLEMGRTYMELERWTEARRELEKAQVLPPTSSPRDTQHQNVARNLLSRLPPRR
ncbi:MAG: hypothetical protein ABIS67_14310 [Candidatus Eisenbacteria bacterium]